MMQHDPTSDFSVDNHTVIRYGKHMEHVETLELITAYTTNMIAAEPELPSDAVNETVAALILTYAAASVDPGTFPYYPHPHNEAETILHHAATYLLKGVA